MRFMEEKIDNKQKVLIAIYTEYQEDLPNMKDNINFKKLMMDQQIFNTALIKLENEKLITGVKKIMDGVLWTDKIMMTSNGIEYVENKLGIEKTLSSSEKVKEVLGKSAKFGWNEAKDILTSTLAKIVRGE